MRCLFGLMLLLAAIVPAIAPSRAAAEQVELDVALANPTMFVPSESEDGKPPKGENFVRIGLTGFELPSAEERLPVNVAIVVDKSGSMRGEKIEQARRAAIEALDRLQNDDIVSVIAYDSSVSVVVPATKASDREAIRQKVRAINANGNTALFAGVSKAAAELRKFLADETVNRIILLSDGQANVGPSSPRELEQLGASLIKEGISVSTMGLGLGYNEDLMSSLAMSSSGNHVFIEDTEKLVQVFQSEFDDVLSVVAKKIKIRATMADGIRPVKVLNYDADIVGQLVSLDLGQLYSRQERYFVVEVEVTCGDADTTKEVANVSVKYNNLVTETTDKLASAIEVKFSDSEEIVENAVEKEIMASCLIQVANQRNRRATALRDEGKIEEARQLLISNSFFLGENFRKYAIPELKLRCEINGAQADMLSSDKWAAGRKLMKQQQFQDQSQQRYSGSGEKSDFNKQPK